MPARLACHCAKCRARKAHSILVIRQDDGKVTRMKQCWNCQTRSPIPWKEQHGLAWPARSVVISDSGHSEHDTHSRQIYE